MKHSLIIGVALVGAAGAGWWLYKRGQAQHAAAGMAGGILPTIRAGVAAVATDLRASAPSTSSSEPASVSSPQFAGTDPRVAQRVPVHSRWRLNSLIGKTAPATRADLAGQGIAS